MERVKVEVNLRERVGKQSARETRRRGCIPAIVYGKNVNFPVEIPLSTLKTLRSIHFSESTIIDLKIVNPVRSSLSNGVNGESKDTHAAIIKKIQYHPLSEEIIHIDFMKVSLKEKIKVHVPLIFKGETKGVKEGATLEQVLRELEIEGLPMDIPEKIEVDISKLDIGDSLHVEDIKVADNLKVITSPEDTIATLIAKKEEEEVIAEVEAPTEPEVIREKKEEEEVEEGKEEKREKEEKKEKKEKKGKEEKD